MGGLAGLPRQTRWTAARPLAGCGVTLESGDRVESALGRSCYYMGDRQTPGK